MFENTAKLNWSNIKQLFILHYAIGVGKDPGYVVFEKTLQYISLDYQTYLFFIAIIFFFALGNFIFKNTSNLKEIIFAYVLYSTLFFFFFSITGHRQTIGLCFIP
jgi:transmembrane protein EpsG